MFGDLSLGSLFVTPNLLWVGEFKYLDCTLSSKKSLKKTSA